MLVDIITAENKMLALVAFLFAFPVLLFSLSAHEYAHGFAAYKQGDGYAKSTGRLTLNPFKHLDPIGTLMMLLIGFGWAKPVPIVPGNFRNGRKSMVIVSIAGIIANIIIATIAMFCSYFFIKIIIPNFAFFDTETGGLIAFTISIFFNFLIKINVCLAIFNLVPIPPLDGYKLFKEIFIGKISYTFFQNIERYSNIILIAFLILSNRIGLISIASNFLIELMVRAMELIFIAF